jgi:hypothetical protein
MRYVIAAALMILTVRPGLAQIAVSGGTERSIIVSGRVRSAGNASTVSAATPERSPLTDSEFAEIFEPEPEPPQPPAPALNPQPAADVTPKPKPAAEAAVWRQERYIVSDPGCIHCPAAVSRFLRSGGKRENVLSIPQARGMGINVPHVPFEFSMKVRVSQPAAPPAAEPWEPQYPMSPIVNTRWGTFDLRTYQRCGNRQCEMCSTLMRLKRQWERSLMTQAEPEPKAEPEAIAELISDAGQKPVPLNVLREMMEAIPWQPGDRLGDLGCGDGRILVAAALRGIPSVGVEIDPAMADKARENIRKAGVEHLATVITGDARAFRPADHKVTVLTAYLYNNLLEELKPTLASVRVACTPFHPIPGLAMERSGNVFVSL